MGNTDDAKGRIKEAAGDLTDNDDLKREGKVDRAAERGQGQAGRCGRQGQRRSHLRRSVTE